MKLAVVAALLFLVLLIGRAFWMRFRHRPVPREVRRQRWLAVSAILLVALFWAGLVGFLVTSGILDTGFGVRVPLVLRAILCLPWLAAAVTVASAWESVRLVRGRTGEAVDRVLAVLFVPLMVGLLALMAYWRLLGPP
jgi:hypothetical protein